jgi:hypothetical protein
MPVKVADHAFWKIEPTTGPALRPQHFHDAPRDAGSLKSELPAKG